MRSSLEIYDLASGQSRVVLQSDELIAAPNWDPVADRLLVDCDGRLYWVPLDAPQLVEVAAGFAIRCNDDHGISRDGRWIALSHHRDKGSEVYLLPVEGGAPAMFSPEAPSWFHGFSPDGLTLTYVAARERRKVIDVYVRGEGPEVRLTQGEGHADAPEFSADGGQIYYNCDRDGHHQIWVMATDGSGQRKLFADAFVNWFPHPSPDGRRVLYLAYPTGTTGIPRDLPVALCLMDPDGGNRRRVIEMTGGKGSVNGPCWAPDGSAFAYVRFDNSGA